MPGNKSSVGLEAEPALSRAVTPPEPGSVPRRPLPRRAVPRHAALEAYAVRSSGPRGLFPSALRSREPPQAGAEVLGTVGARSWLCPPVPWLLEGVACGDQGQVAWHQAVLHRSCCGAKAGEVLLWCSAAVEMIVFACYKLNSPIREL